MRVIKITAKFKKDLKREKFGQHKKCIATEFLKIIEWLRNDVPLSKKYRDHPLGNNWQGHSDCHIKPDLVLIYKKADNLLILTRLGSHSELSL